MMNYLGNVAQLMTASVALVSATVALLSVYFSYRNRHNQFRQTVYNRQMDAYFDITEAMSNLFTAAQNILAASNPWTKLDETRSRLRLALREEHERFTGTVNRSLIVLPSKVKSAVDNFNETLLALSESSEQAATSGSDVSPVGSPADISEKLAKAYERAINCIRHYLAVDSLTSGLLNEMGIGSESLMLKTVRPGVNPLVPVGREAR
jgi:hypothetical protein